MIFLKIYSYDLGIFPYYRNYDFLWVVVLQHLIFLLFVMLGFHIFRVNDNRGDFRNYNLPVSHFWSSEILLIVVFFVYIYLLNNAGLILLSGDYYARQYSDYSSNYFFFSIGILGIVVSLLEGYIVSESWKKLVLLITIFVVCVVPLFLGSRNYTFQVLLYFVYYVYCMISVNRYSRNLYLVLFLLAFYFGGQLVNVLRWYAFDFNMDLAVLQFISDSFNELASYELLVDRLSLGLLSNGVLGYWGFFSDLLSRLIPSFLYSIFGFDRADYYNLSWRVLDPIVWGNSSSLFGVRVGLVGNIHLLIGGWAVPLIGFMYGWLFTLRYYHSLIAVVAVLTIPYGPMAWSYFFIALFFVIIFKILFKWLPSHL